MEQQLEGQEEEKWAAWDDVMGVRLGVKDVKAARTKEVSYMQKTGIWKPRNIKESWQSTGKPLSAKDGWTVTQE